MRQLAFLLLVLTPGLAFGGGDLPTASDNSGAFAWQVAIDVPPGPAEATPALMFAYSSSAGNGEAGVGWSLPYSAIRLDTSWGTPAFWMPGTDLCDPGSFEGRLYLDGAELMPRHTSDGPTAGVCQLLTRPDTYTSVFPVFGHGECSGPQSPLPSGFAAVRADGSTWWYGSDEVCDSPYVERASDDAGAHPTRWLLQHVQDRDGNLVTFHPERLRELPDDTDDWWTENRLPASDFGGCDGCLRAVTWAERRNDTGSAYGAAPGSAPAYGISAPTQVTRFADFAANPLPFWPQDPDHFYAVQIDWEPRPDIRTSFRTGAARRLDRRIRQIVVLGDASVRRSNDRVMISGTRSPIRSYRLDYEAGTTGRSRLTRIWPFPGMYREDGDYGAEIGVPLPVNGGSSWLPSSFAEDPRVMNPWEFVWSENSVLLPDWQGEYQLPEEQAVMEFPEDALPWLGAHWREGGYPTISMVDLNGDSLPEIVQHNEELPRWHSPLEGLLDALGSPFIDQLPYAPEEGVAAPDEADERFWVRWNQGDGFTALVPGPVDPLALQEVGDFLPRVNCDGDEEIDSWSECTDDVAFLSLQDEAASGLALEDLLDGEDLCALWYSGPQSLAWATVPFTPAAFESVHYNPLVASWCEYRSCAPYCEAATTVTFGPHSLADSGLDLVLSERLEYLPNKAVRSAGGRIGGDLVLWRRYAVTQAASGSALSTVQSPFPVDPVLLGIEPRSMSRWVDGYARASFTARVMDSAPLLASTMDEVLDATELEAGELEELLEMSLEEIGEALFDAGTEAAEHTVLDGLVHDTIDINGDGYPDRVLGGAAVLENNTGLRPTKYDAPDEAVINDDKYALKGQAVSTAHMPWFVALQDPDTQSFGEFLLWDLPLTDELLMGGDDELGMVDPDDEEAAEADERLFYQDHGFGFLDVWEMTNTASPSPVTGSASVTPSIAGPAVGMGASIGPVSLGASVSAGGPGLSVGVGPVSFSAGGMSIGPVSMDFSGAVQGGAAGAAGAILFAITKALDVFEIPYSFGISVSPEGFGFTVPGFGGDCAPCNTQARWKRQGLLDINGDGLLDYVIAHNDRWAEPTHPLYLQQAWAVVLNEGDGFADEPIIWPGVPSRFLEFTRSEPYRTAGGMNTQPGFRRSQTMAGLRDINGDGLPDFVYAGIRQGADSCDPPERAPIAGLDRAFGQVFSENSINTAEQTLCVQLNSGTGFLSPVDWFDGSVPAVVFSDTDGFVPSLSGVRTYMERSPTYNDGFGTGIVALQDWNGDGLPDFVLMEKNAAAGERRMPRVFLNDGRRFASGQPSATDRYGEFQINTVNHAAVQATPPGIVQDWFLEPAPLLDVSRTHIKPGGSVIQSAFLDLNGDGTLDWAQAVENDYELGPHIRLIPLQDAVPDLLTQVWEPSGATRRLTYGPARDHMDLPLMPRGDGLPDGSPISDGIPDIYPASTQVVVAQVLYDGLGPQGNEPIGLSWDYADPGFAKAGPSLSAGTGLKHPAFRGRSMGWGRITTRPCPADEIDGNGVCTAEADLTVSQDFATDWMRAGLVDRVQAFDDEGRLRSEESTEWDDTTFLPRYAVDSDGRSAFGVDNWHFAAARTESLALDEAGIALRSASAFSYEPNNGLVSCSADDLDGDQWADRLSFVRFDAGLLSNGKLDVADVEVLSQLPLGALPVDQHLSCYLGMSELGAPYAMRRTDRHNVATGRLDRSETQDLVNGSPALTVEYDYLPGGQLFSVTDSAGQTAYTLWDPTIAAHPIEEHAPPTQAGAVRHVATQAVCGVTTVCMDAAWGQMREQTTPDGNVVTTMFAPTGVPLTQSDLVETEPMGTTLVWLARRLVSVDELPTGLGNLPARISGTRTIDGNQEVTTNSFLDGFGNSVLTATTWVDELEREGFRVVPAGRTDFRGRTVSLSGPCFVAGTSFTALDFSGYDPSAPALGICDTAPPSEVLQYDVLGRMTGRLRPDGASETVVWSHVPGGVRQDTVLDDPEWGDLLETSVTTGAFEVTTIRSGAVTFRHDLAAGLLGDLLPDQTALVTLEERDALGRRTSVWRTGNGNEETRFHWDGFDRLVRYEDPDQGVSELEYDPEGRLAEQRVVDALGAVEAASRFLYDVQGRVELEEHFDNALAYNSGQPNTMWAWSYDVDPGTREPSWVPLAAAGGELGRASEAVQYRWDTCAAGSWTKEQSFSWRYDQRGRVVEDAYSQKSCDWMPGGPTSMVGQTAYGPGDVPVQRRVPVSGELLLTTYDGAGQPSSLESSNGTVVSAASWELHGRPASLEYGNGVVQQYLYEVGQGSSQALTQSAVWSPSGEVLFERSYDWDAAGNLRSWADAASGEGPEAEAWSCDYDGLGTLLGCLNDNDPEEWMEYSYDVLGSLIREDVRVDGEDRFASQFSRGTAGLASMYGLTAPLNAPTSRVVGPDLDGSANDAMSMFYDARGHLVTQRYHDGDVAEGAQATEQGLVDGSGSFLASTAERTFEWNAVGRLESVSVGAAGPVRVSRYWYGPDGNRTGEQVTPESGGSWTQARRFGGTRLVEELGGVVKQATSWSFGGMAVGQSHLDDDPAVPGGQALSMRWTGGDHLGSASIVTDEEGELVRGVRYEPYGRVRDEWGPDAEPEDYAAAGLDDLFNGKPRTRDAFGMAGSDQQLEGYDYGARIYLPELSRFASADTITPDGVWEANAFAYVRNNPLKYVDPDGHSVWLKLAKIGWKVAKGGGKGLNWALTFKGVLDDWNTLSNPNLPFSQHLIAGLSLSSELLPLSVDDIRWLDDIADSGQLKKMMANIGDAGNGLESVADTGIEATKQAVKSTTDVGRAGAATTAKVAAREGAASVTTVSKIKNSSYAVRIAERMSDAAQRDVDNLLAALRGGNSNPGLGTRALGGGFYELRGRNGGRVIVKKAGESAYDIVGKFQGHARGKKANSDIIQKLMSDYGAG